MMVGGVGRSGVSLLDSFAASGSTEGSSLRRANVDIVKTSDATSTGAYSSAQDYAGTRRKIEEFGSDVGGRGKMVPSSKSKPPSNSRRKHFANARLDLLLTELGGNQAEWATKLGLPLRTLQTWLNGDVQPQMVSVKRLVEALGLSDSRQLDNRYDDGECWVPISKLAKLCRLTEQHSISLCTIISSGYKGDIFDRFVDWMPFAAERHMREMMTEVRLSDEDSRDRVVGDFVAELRLGRLGVTESAFEIPAYLKGISDHYPSKRECLELEAGLPSPTTVWVPTLSFATPALISSLRLDHLLEVDVSMPHSVSLAKALFIEGEPDVLVIGPQAYIQLCRRPDFLNVYRLVDRWHNVDVRIMGSANSESTSEADEGSQYVFTDDDHSTDKIVFNRLCEGNFVSRADGQPKSRIDPLNYLRARDNKRVLAFAPYAYAAEALGIGRQVTAFPSKLLGQPMFLIFHARLWRDRARIAALLLARIRHAWWSLATSEKERKQAAKSLCSNKQLLWTNFYALNLIDPALS